MAKPKSSKLRTLITLYALFKHTDENHRLNTKRLNTFLEPYNLSCNNRVIGDSVKTLREWGLDIKCNGEFDKKGFWIDNRPLSETELSGLIFAITTNLFLSKEQVANALESLKSFVTVWQEDSLKDIVETSQIKEFDDSLYGVCLVIINAIHNSRRIRYTYDYAKYNEEIKKVFSKRSLPVLFTPKCIYQTEDELYMVGYNHPNKRVEAVNLKDIVDIKFAFKQKDKNHNKVSEKLKDINPSDYISEKPETVIYEGPLELCFRGRYLTEVYKKFGPPDKLVNKTKHWMYCYSVKNARITSKTLFWLSQVKDLNIRIIGPQAATERIRAYYDDLEGCLLSSSL